MRLLITGMSGVGKSAVLTELAARGWPCIDTDDGWCLPQSDGTQLWDLDRLRPQLDNDPIVIAGCEANMGELVPLFDAVVLLTAPLDVMRARIETRANPWGKSEVEWAKVVADTAEVVPMLRAIATIELDTSAPLEDTVAAIEALLRSPGPRAH